MFSIKKSESELDPKIYKDYVTGCAVEEKGVDIQEMRGSNTGTEFVLGDGGEKLAVMVVKTKILPLKTGNLTTIQR